MTVPCNECLPLGKDLNHLTFFIVNFSSIWELARPEKPEPIIKFNHMSYSIKFLLHASQSQVKYERIPYFQIFIFMLIFILSIFILFIYVIYLYLHLYLFKASEPKILQKMKEFSLLQFIIASNLWLFQEQECSCIKRNSWLKIMISLANIAHKDVFLWPMEVHEMT